MYLFMDIALRDFDSWHLATIKASHVTDNVNVTKKKKNVFRINNQQGNIAMVMLNQEKQKLLSWLKYDNFAALLHTFSSFNQSDLQ